MLYSVFGSRQREPLGPYSRTAALGGQVVSRPFIVMESCFIDGHPRVMDYCWLLEYHVPDAYR